MRKRLVASALVSVALSACDGGGSGGAGGGGQGGASGGQGGGGSAGQGGGGQGGAPLPCLAAEGTPVAGSGTWTDGPHQATVTVGDAEGCARTYSLATTAPLRDGLPENPRAIEELPGQPVVRTGNDLFDALYALALAEAREASVDSIHDGAFNGGAPLPCPPGGCFETGRLWTYVWTRDTAYSVALGLGLLDPTRARNSLEWKLSPRRDGAGLEIVQDTGTGGSWPVSTDRVVWAMGARALLDLLSGEERAAFAERARQAVTQTAERDRLVAWDEADGLYRGEQSFLDWREQTYAAFTATDTVQIAMSKALGTNVAHLSLLELARDLAAEAGDAAGSQTYAGWADDLRAAIGARFWLAEEGLPSSFLPGPLDPAPTRRFDLLGTALAVLSGSLGDAEAAEAVASYPHLERGAPVIWPQQQDVAIYHNRSLWPFVTAFWAKAAARARNATAVAHAARSLIRGAALNLSNMENFEAVTGATWVDEGPTSGPVVDSHRQLWSVAGYVSLVHEVLFGLETSKDGVRFAPHLPAELAASLFGSSQSIALSRVPFQGKRVSVRVRLPPAGAGGLLSISSVTLDGVEIGDAFTPASSLADGSVFEVTLGPSAEPAGDVTLAGDPTVYQNLFGPRTPSVDAISIVNDRVRIGWSLAESPADVTFAVYRDGVRIADALPGATTTFDDATSAAHATTTYCYAVEARFASGNASQRSRPVCYWGPASARVQVWDAQSFSAQGGALTFQYGKWHYQDWGDPSDALTLAGVIPAQSGLHWLQVSAGNGAGGFTTGITCGVKAIEVWDGATLVARGELVMPHLGTWDDWRDSSLVPAVLQAGKPYAVIVREDAASGNMSDLDHFSLYGGTGGLGGRFDKVNVAEIKLLAMGP